MSNSATPKVTPVTLIDLDKERAIRLDFNALCLMEDKFGRSILTADTWKKLRSKDLKFLLFAGLQHEDPTLTEKEVGSLVHIGNLQYVMERITAAWSMSVSGPGGSEGILPLEIKTGPVLVATAVA